MPPIEIPINQGTFKTKYSRNLRNSPFAESLINLMVDNSGANVDRPTLELYVTLPSTEVIGLTMFNGMLIAVTLDRKLFAVVSIANIVDITGVPLPGTERPTFASDGTNLYIVGGGAPLVWAGIGNTTALLGGSPPSMTHLVYLDGYLSGNRRLASEHNKVIQWADFEDTDTWPGANIFSAVGDPDEVQGDIVSQRDLYVVGTKTTEIWQNVGTSPVPFARAFVWNYGTPAKYSIGSADNSVLILTQDRQILRFIGRTPTRISEPIEQDIAGYARIDDCVVSSFNWDGSVHVMFIFPDVGKTWSIDLKNGQWTEWRGYDSGWERVRINSLVYDSDSKTVYAGDFGTGKIFKFSNTIKTDAGGIFKRVRRFSHRDGGVSYKKCVSYLRCNVKRGVAASFSGEDSNTNPSLELRWKDDERPWTEFQRVQLGGIGDDGCYAEFRRLGEYRSRQYELQISDPCEFNLIGVETEEEVLPA